MESYKYYAFISYARKDSTKLAKYIQRELEHYRYPMAGIEESRKPNDKQFLRKIFLDLNELENSERTFFEELLYKIENSKFLIVLCSEESAKSKWVEDEIQHFLQTHDNNYNLIVPVLIKGKVPENIPQCLQKDEILNRNLPNFIEFEGDEKNEAKERGLSQLIAYLLGIQREKVANRFQIEKRKQQLKLIKIFAILLFLFICLTAWALFERSLAIKNETIANKQREEQRYTFEIFEKMLGHNAAEQRNISVKELLEDNYRQVYDNDNPYIKIQLGLSFVKILSWHNPERANELLEDTIKIIERLPEDLKNRKMADYYKCKGDFYKIRNEYNMALDFYKMALSYKFDTPEKYSETYWEMANIYDNTKDYDNAEKYLLEYINKAKSTESKSLRKSNLQKAYYQLTRMYISLKDYKKALLYNEENLAIDSSLHKEIIDAELKYLLKQYPQSLQEVEKINLYNINEFSGHPLIYFARNSVINVLAYSKINPNDTEGAKKLNSEKNEFFNSIIQSIINDKSLDFDNKKHNIRRYCTIENNKLLLLQDNDIHFYEMEKNVSDSLQRVELYTILENYQKAAEIGERHIEEIQNPVLKLKMFALLKQDYAMLHKQTGVIKYSLREKYFYNEFMNLYQSVQKEIKNAKTTPAQKEILLDEIKTKMLSKVK